MFRGTSPLAICLGALFKNVISEPFKWHSAKGFMNIAVLTYLEQEGSKDYDPVVPQVAAAMRKARHKVSVLGVHSDLKRLMSGLKRLKPDLVFNLMEKT